MKKSFKKREFMIDKITEDSFYENLLLGVSSLLKSSPFVSQINLQRYLPATAEQVNVWETTNFFILPDDLKNFYLSSNGFSFSYKFQYEKAEEDKNFVMGLIEINPLSDLLKIETSESLHMIGSSFKIPESYSKIFVLSKLQDNHCVVLAQFDLCKPPNIWLYHKMKNFYFLCNDFVTYFRMALAYVGTPGWQLAILNANLPEYSSEMALILAPGIFEKTLIDYKSELNVLDPNIFIFGSGDSAQKTAKSHGVDGKVKGEKNIKRKI